MNNSFNEYEKLDLEIIDIEKEKQEIINKNKKIFDELTIFENKVAKIKEQQELLKEKLIEEMEKADIKKFESDHLVITYIGATIRTIFDKDKFIAEMGEDVYSNYTKESPVKSQVRIKIKNAVE